LAARTVAGAPTFTGEKKMPSAVMSETRARQIAESWTEAWNARDLDSLMSHYADNVVFMSPTVVMRDGEPSGVIHGKAALTEHFREGLESFGSAVKFTLLDACVGVRGYALYYQRETGAKVIVAKRLDEHDKIIEARVHYHSPRS
jgi:ketosteroid isomerase-like protein